MSHQAQPDRPDHLSSSAIVRGASLIKDASRLRHIVTIAARHGLGEVLERLKIQDNVIVSTLARASDGDRVASKTMPERVREALQELGPTFVKLGQVFSTRPDVIPEEYIEQLRRLQDDVAPVELTELESAITDATGGPLSEVFAEIDAKPVAAASVAQVHRARLFSGEEVAVKVLRPSVREVVSADIGVMYFLARRLESTFAEARSLNLVAMVREFERAMRRELDLRNEARNLRRFDTMFVGRADIRVPAVFSDISGRDALVMEFIEGEKITEAAEKMDDQKRDDLVRACFDVLFIMVLREGLFHGDLHPGNVKITSDGAIAIYDVGLVGRLTPMMRERVVDLLLALSQRDYQAVSEAFYDMAVRTRPVNMGQFAGEVADLLDQTLSERTLSELDLGSLLAQLGELGVRFGMRVPSEYAMMIKAILTLEGVGKTLAPEVDPIEAARPYVVEVLQERYSPERLGTEAARTLLSMSRVARELPPTIHEMLRSVEGGRVRVGVDLSTGDEVGPLLRKVVSPVTDAVLVGGFTVAGALALSHGEPFIIGVPPTSLVLFIIAALFLGRTLISRRSIRKK